MTQLKNMYVLGKRYCSRCQKETSEQWCEDGHSKVRTRTKPVHNKRKPTSLEVAKRNKHRACKHRRVSSGRWMLFKSISDSY